MLSKIKKEDADQSFKRSLLPIVQQQPELFGRHAQSFRGAGAYTILLDLAHRMASLIMAYGFDIEREMYSEEDEEEEADGSSQSAYELNKGMVPFADLFNAGTSEIRNFLLFSDAYLNLEFETSVGSTVFLGLVLRFILHFKRAGLTPKSSRW